MSFEVSRDVLHVYYLLGFQMKTTTITVLPPTCFPFTSFNVFALKPTQYLINFMVTKTSKTHFKTFNININVKYQCYFSSHLPRTPVLISIERSWNNLKISILQVNFYFLSYQLQTMLTLVVLLIEPPLSSSPRLKCVIDID